MATRSIFCVGFDLPGEEFEYIAFESDRSLLDADIVLFEPTLGDYNSSSQYNGKPLVGEYDSPRVTERLAHWRSELAAAVNAGKLVIIYLAKPAEAFRHTGRNEYSGTGRNRQVTNIVEPITSYSTVPRVEKVVPAEGTGVRLTAQSAFLAPYWKEVAPHAKYEVYIDGTFTQVVLQTKSGDRTLGAVVRGKGNLLFLPPLRYPEAKFLKWDKAEKTQHWTPEAMKFGKRLVSAIVGLADALATGATVTPPPDWSHDARYQLAQERSIAEQISTLDQQVLALRKKREALEQELSAAGTLRGLLYEQGAPLEAAILQALRALGFVAGGFNEGESEFDAVFTSPEGRFLGEAEGKDNKAINIDKLSQLERNLQEDFQREEVNEYAKGVLFGNAQRLSLPTERGEGFTAKCISGAKRAKIALVSTVDLFGPAKYLKDHDDPTYAKSCRGAIFDAEGEVVAFPAPPIEDHVSAGEAK